MAKMKVDKSKARGYRETKANVLSYQNIPNDPNSTIYYEEPGTGGKLEKMSDHPDKYGREDYLMENVHKQEGVFEGEVYYSPTMPKGKRDDWPYAYDKKMYRMFSNIQKADNDSLKKIQGQMIDMGLLEPGQDDGLLGRKTMGGARRYLLNSQPSLFDAIKESDLNIFK